MDRRSISERGKVSKSLVRTVSIVFEQPVGEVEIGLVKVIETNLRESKPFILKGPVEAFQARIVLGATDAGKEVVDVEQATGTLKLTREFPAVVRMDIGQVAFG